jgi:hypothetical protein
MPVPTLGLEAYRHLNENLIFQGSIEGNWINRWNSLRDEGGKVWASESGFEVHARDDPCVHGGSLARWI